MNLEEHKKKINQNPFKTPEGYFENNQANFLNSLPKLESSSEKELSFGKKNQNLIYASMAIESSFLLIFFLWNNNPTVESAASNSFELAEIPEDYLDEDAILDLYETETMEETNDETIDYLLEDDISIDLIAENI